MGELPTVYSFNNVTIVQIPYSATGGQVEESSPNRYHGQQVHFNAHLHQTTLLARFA